MRQSKAALAGHTCGDCQRVRDRMESTVPLALCGWCGPPSRMVGRTSPACCRWMAYQTPYQLAREAVNVAHANVARCEEELQDSLDALTAAQDALRLLAGGSRKEGA